MTARYLIGAVMLSLPFVMLFVAAAISLGFWVALLVYAGIAALLIYIWVATELIS